MILAPITCYPGCWSRRNEDQRCWTQGWAGQAQAKAGTQVQVVPQSLPSRPSRLLLQLTCTDRAMEDTKHLLHYHPRTSIIVSRTQVKAKQMLRAGHCDLDHTVFVSLSEHCFCFWLCTVSAFFPICFRCFSGLFTKSFRKNTGEPEKNGIF